MNQRPPHLLPGQSPQRQAQLLAESPLESWHHEVAQGGVFSADKLAALFLVLGLVFSQIGFIATPAAEAAVPVAVADAYVVDEGGSLSTVGGTWHLADWRLRRPITFSNAGRSQLDDFPVLVRLDPADIDYTRTQGSGEDLRFVDADGTPLDYEIEDWNSGSVSYAWVRVPQIDAGSTTDSIWMYYDNDSVGHAQDSSGVWSNGYVGVWHMNQDPGASQILDSTSFLNHGAPNNMDASNLQPGAIGGGLSFPGVVPNPDYIRIPSDGADELSITGTELTLEAWAQQTGDNGMWSIIVGRQLGTGGGDSFALFGDQSNPDRLSIVGPDNMTGNAGSLPLDQWRYVAGVRDGTNLTLYSEGLQVGQFTGLGSTISTDANDVTIGAEENDGTANPTEAWLGMLDEVRISNISRSVDWIAAQNASMTDSFATYGTEEEAGVLANDTDPESDPLTASLVGSPSHAASFTLNADGSFDYTPAAGMSGTDSFTYVANDGTGDSNVAIVTITVTATGPNSPPEAVDDPSASTDQDIAAVVDVLGNDSDPDTDPLTISAVAQGSNGSVVNNGSDVTYTPDAGWTGVDSFTYEASDSNGGFDTATVTLTVSPPASYSISGTVFEDIAGDVLNDGTIGDANNPGAVGVDVYLYEDTNTNTILDVGTDTLVAGPVVTNSSGVYSFSGLADLADYFVRVDSTTVPSSQDPTALQGDLWAEQTYAPADTWCADGTGGAAQRGSAGPCYGGRDAGVSDSGSAPEHYTMVAISGASATGVDYGFSHNIVVNTLAGDGTDHDLGANRTVQGSLRQFIDSANVIAGDNTMRFVPAVPANDGTWWEVSVTNPLPAVTDSGATIDGTAHEFSDGATLRNTNTGFLGANAGGGVNVGVDGVPLPQVDAPELEIQGDQTAPSPPQTGFVIQADSTTVRRLAIYGFGDHTTAGTDANIQVGPSGGPVFEGIVIEQNVIGSAADGFVDPGLAVRTDGNNVHVTDAISGGAGQENRIRDNLIGFTYYNGVMIITNTGGWLVTGNEIRAAGLDNASGPYMDTLAFEGTTSSGHSAIGNLITQTGGPGIDTWRSPGGNTIENNDLVQNGSGGAETAGLRIFGAGSTVSKNVITNNTGPGVIVVGERPVTVPTWSAATGNLISQNQFGTNTGIAIDLVESSDLQAPHGQGDGVTLAAGTLATTGNNGVDAPVIATATTALVSGTTCANCDVEVYRAVAGAGDDSGGTNYGEGVEFLGTANADGSGDWTLTGITALSTGDEISAITIDGSNTSEFAANVAAGCADSDTDGLCDLEEDANTDADNDPATSPGPNTDGDANPNYLDADDDGDGTATASENADPNGDGDPRDARDSDQDGQSDYLDLPTGASTGLVGSEQKISHLEGGLPAVLGDGDRFGSGAVSIGDLDGDGNNDLAVGALFDDDGGTDRGAVYILFLNANGSVDREQKISSTTGGLTGPLDNSDYFGADVASVGDVDGDGINDLGVGSYFDDNGGGDRGAVYVLFLNTDGTVKGEQKISSDTGGLTGPLGDNDQFGRSVSGIGDLDGDGINDIVVGANYDDDGGTDRGAVYVLFLNTDGTVKGEQKISDTQGGFGGILDDVDYFGRTVAGIGDVDGDGAEDIAVGAFRDDDGGADRGAVYVLFLNTDGTVKGEQKISSDTGGLTGPLDDLDRFGTSVSGVGDVDSDGVVDIAVGAFRDDDGGADRGAVYVLFLNTDGTVKGEQKISSDTGGLTGPLVNSDEFGASVTGLGDLDGDSFIDIAVGAFRDDDGGADRGAVYVLYLAVPNGAPSADAGGPYSTAEGEDLILDGSGSTDPDTDPLTYNWDIDNDGQYDDATGPNPTVAWLTLVGLGFDDDGGPYPIGLEVDDGNGNTDTATVNWTIANAPPAITVTGNGSVGAGSVFTANLSVSDPGDDTVTGWTINWGDGSIQPIAGNPASATHTYANPGEYNITAAVEDEDSLPNLPWHNDRMVVPGLFANAQLFLLEATTGTVGPNLAFGSGQGRAITAIIGPDGLAYVGDYTGNSIRRYDPVNELDLGVWIPAGTGGLNGPAGMQFGPDGHLYISSNFSDEILEFAADGTFLGVFASGGGLDEPDDLTFGPDGHLYVTSFHTDQVLKYNGRDGNPMGEFAAGPEMEQPSELVFGPGGQLYVTSVVNNQVVRYNADGSLDTVFATAGATGLNEPRGATFGPDGHLYVGGRNRIVRYDGSSGVLIDTYLPSGSISGPSQSTFVPAHRVTALPLIVNSTGDASDNNPGDGVCHTGDVNSATDPECTLRAAIEEANAFPGTDTINFDMPVGELGHSGGVWTISPLSDFDQLTGTVIIDGTTQPGWTATPVVEVNGNGAVSDGFRITADDVEIHGLAINRFPADGIEVGTGAQNTVIAANHIGLDATGLIDRGNGGRGIDLGAGSGPTRVGGTEVSHRNIISGNGGDGIIIWNSNANTVFSNFIGTDVTGLAAIENGADGIAIGGTSNSNLIGQVGDLNVISGNVDDGVANDAAGVNNAVYYNIIGLGSDANTPVPNGGHGVAIYDGGNTTFVYQNLISGNANSGVVIDGNGNAATTANYIIGNWIGLNLVDQPRPNGGNGVHIFGGATGNFVGGMPAAYRNVISGNAANGVFIVGSATSGNRIENNHIGTTIAGDAAVANGDNGIHISGAPSNAVGGTTVNHRNVVSGNGNNGILLDAATATGNTIQGNYFGLNAAGDAAVPNADEGVDLSDAPGNTVGGTSAGERNVISGNADIGVLLIGAGTTGNSVAGNYIGTNAAGDAPIANGRSGVYVEQGASSNTIGGATAGHRNVISGNVEDGIYITSVGTTANTVTSNYIGTSAAGDAAIPNGDRGVQVESGASGNFVGMPAQGNVISGNTGDGVIVADFLSLGTTDNEVVDNLIGVAADGTTPLGNGANGVHLDPVSDTLIESNTIANNGQDGVVLETVTLAGNSIVGNSIYGNGQLGIDIGNDSVDTNDPLDGDGGANEGMNYPEPTSATETGGTITFDFDLDVPPGTYWIDVFANPNGTNLSGNGEGEVSLLGDTITSAGSGVESFSITIAGSAGDVLTATTTRCVDGAACTDPGSTSEFSVPITVVSDVFVVNSTGDSADASPGNGVCSTGGTIVGGDPECTLRAAIEEANFAADANSIEFDIPTSDSGYSAAPLSWTIVPGAPYDDIIQTVSIDATTQPGFVGDPVIQLVGSNPGAAGATAALTLESNNSLIEGFIVHTWMDDGLEIDASTGKGDNNTFRNNWVGIDAAENLQAITDIGILITDGANDNTIEGNVVGGATNAGIEIRLVGTDNNIVIGNSIGVGPDGTSAIPNGSHGISLFNQTAGNRIGGTGVEGNLIANNAGDGIWIADTAGTDNAILGNSIYDNGGLGIDLDLDGVTPNGPGDPLNYPVIDSAVIAPPWITVSYTIDAPAGDYVVEFFSNPSGTDPTGYGEGEAFEYQDSITHPGGSASYVAVFSGFVTDVLTATITEDLGGSYGSTSEFSGTSDVTNSDLVVNSGGNTGDAAPGNGACDTGGTIIGGDPECTLEAAIQEANALGGSVRIEFAIPDSDTLYRNLGAGLSYWRIQPTASLTPITGGDITIDATTQTSYAIGQGYFVNDTGPEVEINGSNGVGGNGLEIQGNDNEIRGFTVNRFVTGIGVLSGDGNVIAGNYLGPDPSGANGVVGNFNEGVEVDGATNTVIGGTAIADRNVISGNRLRGIAIDTDSPTTAGIQIIGNYIGTNAAGDAALLYDATNVQQVGVYIFNAPHTVVGTAADGNVISGNSWFGVYGWGSNATGTVIQGNVIGLDATELSPVPNATDLAGGRAGISLSSIPGALIGGDLGGEGNIIAENGEYGIVLYAAAATSTTVIGNQIYGNSDIGIDLGGDGVSVNAPGDPLNFPEITSATESGGTVTVDFDLDVPIGDYRIEFFVNPSGADLSGYGEGETFVDSYDIVGHPGGLASYSTSFAGSTGDIVSATTTEETADPFGSTSEFSAAVTVTFNDTTPPVITLVGANPQVIEVGSPYVELGATALDDVDGDITGSIVIDASAVNTSVLGSYIVTYNVSDSAGNPAIEVTRTVDVVDTTVPVITLIGANPQTIEVGSGYTELGATATDNYDGDLSGSIVINSSAVNTSAVGSYLVTYNVSDANGNAAAQVTRTVDVVDTTVPVITLIGANPQTIEVGAGYTELGATATDNYDGDLTGSIVIDSSAVNTAVVGSYAVTYNVSDANGNAAAQVTRTVDVVDTTVPVITLIGANPQTIEVGAGYSELGATATDNYDGDLTGSIVVDSSAVNTAVVGTYSVTYDVTDSEGNAAVQVTRTVDVVDTTIPVITLIGANPQTVEVGSAYVELGATAIDNYDGDISGSIVVDASAVVTSVVGSYTVTYDVTDSEGNAAVQVTRTVDVVDTTAPVITLIGANPQVIEVGSAYVELGATAFDIGDGDVTGSIVVDSSAVDTSTVGSYPVTYDVTDSHGNAATQVTRTVDVVDTTAPVITLIGANPQTLEANTAYVELGATAADIGDGDLTGSIVIDATGVNMAAVGSYSVTYDVTDSQGNAAVQVTRTVDVVDTTAPVITLTGANPQTIEAGSPYVELGATALDNYDGDITPSIVIDATAVDTAVVGSYPVTYDVTDSEGNAASQVTRTVNVVDTTDPIITLVGPNPQVIEVASPYAELGATAFDIGDGDISGSIVIDATAVNTAVLGSYLVTYDVTDSQGNAAVQVTRTVDVVDTTLPVITLVGANPQNIEAGSSYVELGATATDNYDGDITPSIVIDATAVDTGTVGSYPVTYNVTDANGNVAIQVTRTVNVTDTTAPVISLVGPNPQVIEVGSAYVELGATAFDIGDGDVSGSIVIDATAVNTAVVGSYGVTYDVTDSQGNAAIQVVRTVDIVDTTLPVITLTGANPQVIEVGSPYVELGATATDNYDGDLTPSIVINAGGVLTTVVGSYAVTYDVTDANGNAAIQVVRTVDVVDTTAPVITLVGPNPQVIEVGSPYVELGATAFDIGDGDVSGSVIIDATAVDTGVVGSYGVTYDVTDSQGNAATQVTRTVNVVDTTLPVITLTGANPQVIEVGSPYVELGATALDNYDGDISGSIVIDATWVNTGVVGSHAVTYDVTDSNGNAALTVTRTVDVVDTTVPVIALVGPNPQVIEAGSPYLEQGATAFDNYDGDISGSIVINATAVNTAVLGSYPVTYDVTDSNGNAAVQVTRTVDVVDTTVPVITLVGPNPQVIEVGSPYVEQGATAFDNYDGDISGSIVINAAAVNTNVVGTYVVTYDVVDSSGNPAVAFRTVDVVDTTVPVITLVGPNPQVIEVHTPYTELGATAFDNYDGDISGSIVIDASAVNTAVVGTYVVTYNVTDSNGNAAAQVTRTVSVIDTTAPVITLLGADPQTVGVGSPYVELGATALDNYDGDISGSIVIDTSAVNTAVVGTYVVTYNVTDSNGNAAIQVTRSVNVVNVAPTLNFIGDLTVAETTLATFTATATDPDPTDVLAFSLIGAPAGAGIDPVTGIFTWTPTEAQGPGIFVFDVVVTDSAIPALSDTQTVTITVTEVNLPPVLGLIPPQTVDEMTVLSFVAPASDPDVPANARTFILTGAPAGATVDPATGVFTWLPSEAQGPGVYVFDVTVSDGGTPVLSDSQPVTVTVNEVNLAPMVNSPGPQSSAEANVITLPIVAVDTDIPVNALTYAATGLPDGLSIDPATGVISGTIDYTANAASPFDVVVTVTDNGAPVRSGQTNFAWTVADTNRDPIAGNDTVITAEDTTVVIDARLNDSDPDGDPLLVIGFSPPANGSVDLTAGTLRYRSDANYNGPDSFMYTVADGRGGFAIGTIDVVVTAVNDSPVVNALTSLSIDEGSAAIFVASATDVEGDAVTFSLGGEPPGATINAATGRFAWTPSEAQGPGSYVIDVIGTDDGAPAASTTRQVTINVAEVNEAPVIVNPGTTVSAENQAVSLAIVATDPDLPRGTLRYSAGGLPPGLSIDPATGEISGVIPFDGTSGSSYAVTITVRDDGVPELSTSVGFTWVVTNTNRAPSAYDIAVFADAGVPVSLILNATDPDGDALSFSISSPPTRGTLTGGPRLYDYMSPVTASGTDSFTYTVSDGDLQATGVVTVTITPNLPPTGGPDEYTVRSGGVLVVDAPGVLRNDRDPEGEPISAILVSPPEHGDLTLEPDGSFTYRNTGGLADIDVFSYRVDDGMQLSSVISVIVNFVDNIAPTAENDTVSLDEDTSAVFFPLANDFDENDEPILASKVDDPAHGTIDWSLDGAFVYRPARDWNGTEVISYEITDGDLVASASITIEVRPVNDPPVASPARVIGQSGEPLTIDLSPYATDVDGDPIEFILESPHDASVIEVGSGLFEINLDGVISDLPPLTFVASDPMGGKDTSLLTIVVEIPAELVGVPSLVSDDLSGGNPDVTASEDSDPPGGGPLVTGLRLMVGSVLDTFSAFRIPMAALLLVFLGSLLLGFSRRFAFSSAATALPMAARTKVDIVMAPSSAGVPAREEPGSHQGVVHRFAPDAVGIGATGARSLLRSELWIEVDTPDGSAWINAEFLTEQQPAAVFKDDERPGRQVADFVDRLYHNDDLLPVTGGRDLHVALYGPPVRFAAGALPRMLSGGSVYWWWGPEGDTPRHQGTFAETVGESFAMAYRNQGVHALKSSLAIPVEFVNMHSLVVGNHELGEGWRVFFRFEGGEPLIAGLMSETAPNPAAMHGRSDLQAV